MTQEAADADRRPARGLSALLVIPWLALPAWTALSYLLLPPVTEMRSRYQASGLVLAAAGALAWLLTRRSPLAHHTAAALSACVLSGLSMISLHGSDWWFAGPSGDQAFRLEYATRFAADLGSLDDYTYRDVPAFYSPGWFWAVGLVSRLSGWPAWHAYKWASVAALFVATALAFWLWRRTCSTRLSALLVVVTAVGLPSASAAWLGSETLLRAGVYEPYAWIVALSLPALLTWWGRAHGSFSWGRGLALGVALAAAAWGYSLYAGLAVVAVVAVAVWRGSENGRRLEVLLAGVTSVVLVLPWLGPFVVAYLEAGTPTVLATTYVNEASYVRLVSAEASPWLALALAGAVALLGVSGEQFRLLRGCQALLLTVLLFGVLQLLGGQVGRGVLFHRAQIVLGVTLLAGGTLAIALGGPRLRAALVRRLPGVRLPQLGAAVLGVALFLGLSGHGADWMARDDAWRGRAHDRPTPDGRLSPLASGEARQAAGAQLTVAELAAAVERVSAEAGRPADAVVLTDIRELMATTPVFGYLQWWELYSNPLGEYPRRKAFVERLARTDPAEFPATLRSEPDGPTVFLLRVDGDQVSYRSSGWDPDRARTTPWSVRLPAAALESPDFASTRVDDWLVAALRTR